jgi:excisionase family DNA binding protein
VGVEKMCLSVEEMGEMIGISRSNAYELTRKKGFPSVRLGKRIIIPIVELSKWLARQAEVNGHGEPV